MASQLQLRGGTTAEHGSFTGAIRELTVDTTLKALRLHDGVTAGGTVIASLSDIQALITALSDSTSVSLTTEAANRTSAVATLTALISSSDAVSLASAQSYTDTKISDILNGAPELLNTLNELAAAINDDESFATTLTTSLSNETTARGVADAALQAAVDLRATIDNPTFTTKISSPEFHSVGGHIKFKGSTNDIMFYPNNIETLQITRNSSTGHPTFTANGGTGEFKFNQVVDLADGVKIGGVDVTSTAAELNSVDGVTSNVQAQIDALSSTSSTGLNTKAPIESPTFTTQIESPEYHSVGTGHLKFKGGGNDIIFYPQDTETLQITRSGTDCRFTSNGGTGTFKFNQITEFDDGVTLDGVSVTAIQSSGESFADNDTSLMTSAAINDLIGANGTTLTDLSITSTAAELNILDGVTATTAELNILDGVTSTAAELNILDGVTATATELNYVDGVTSAVQTQINTVVASAAVSTGILNATPGTVAAQKAVITDADKDAKGFRVIEADEYHSNGSGHLKFKSGGNDIIFYPQDTETLQITRSGTDVRFTSNGGSGTFKFNQEVDLAGGMKLGSTAITSTAAELNILDGVTATAAELNALDGITSTVAELNILDGVTSTATELNLLDGVTATTAELNYVDGVTSNIQTQLDAIQSDVNTNESDADTAIALRATIASPTFTGTPAAPTASAGTNTTQLATTAFVTTAVANTIDGAPGALDTLNELAAALNDDASFSTTVTNLINANETHIDNVATLSGVAKDSTHLSTFTGSTISDNQTIKAAIQALETAVETKQATDAELTELATMASATAAALADLTEAEVQILDGATVTTAELNILDGVTSTAAELNILDGVTSTAAELNILDGVTSTAAELNILDGVTSTAAELNILDGVTSTAAELNLLDGVTATTAELNYVDGVTSAIQTQLDAKLASSGAKAALDVDHLITLSGVSDAADNLGTFTGSTISDNGTVKAGMQELETAVETKVAAANSNLTGTTVVAAIDLSGDIDCDGTANLDAVDIDGDVDIAGDLTFSAAKDIHFIDNNAAALEFAEGGNAYLTFVTTDGSNAVKVSKNLDIDADDIDVSTQATDIKLIDNTALALRLMEGTTEYLRVTTTNSGEKIDVSTSLQLDGAVDINGAVDCSGDVTFSDAQTISVTDNLGFALRVMEGSNEYVRFVTTDGSEEVDFSKSVKLDGGMTLGGGINVPASQDITMVASNSNAIDFVIDGGNRMMRFNTNTETVLMEQNIDVDGTANLDVVDIDGAVDMASTLIMSGGLTNAANDTAAASAGVAVNQLYRNGSVVMIRVS